MIDVRNFRHRDGKGKALGNLRKAIVRHASTVLAFRSRSITTDSLPDDQAVHDVFL